MARKNVVQIKCDRCGRDETLDRDPGERGFQAAIGALSFKFQDLCTPCVDLLKKTLENVGSVLEKRSPVRKEEPAVASKEVAKKEPPAKPVVLPTR